MEFNKFVELSIFLDSSRFISIYVQYKPCHLNDNSHSVKMNIFAHTFCLKTYTHKQKFSQNIEFRADIKFLSKEGANAKEIHQPMAYVYGDSSQKYWHWQSGQQNLNVDKTPYKMTQVALLMSSTRR